MSIKASILNPLLDKYETSAHFRNEARVNRRILLKLKPPLYDIENPTNKLAVHQAIEELNKKELIHVHWLKGEEGNIIRQVQLNLDNVNLAYKEIRRSPKQDLLKQAKQDLQQLTESPFQWLRQFASQTIACIDDKHHIPRHIPEQRSHRQKLLACLDAIAKLENEEMLERVFSKRVCKDSKYFEQHLRTSTAGILKRWLFKNTSLDTDEVLQQAGLHKSSDELLFTGAIQVSFRNKTIDFADFVYGTAIHSRMVNELAVTGFRGEEIVTIENKASYREFCSQMDIGNTAAIYLGGFPGPAKRKFLNKLYTYTQKNNPSIKFRHWGDIDLGGFRIFVAAREAVPTLEPLLMDKETLIRHKDQGQPLTENYRQQLEALLEDERYQLFREVMGAMLAEDLRLEQEGVVL